MFKINDVIIYGTQGVCRIAGIEEKTVSGVTKTYFVLKPVSDDSSTIFAPTDNECVLKKMRRLLSKPEIDRLINRMSDETIPWIDHDNDRKEHFRKILANGDRAELIQMMRSVYSHKKAREAEGKRLHMIDEQFFKSAEQILYHEFQYVLNLDSKDELVKYILLSGEK